jgi:hypothetical protein
MSWLKVDEARTEGRKLTCGMFAAEYVESKYELGRKLGSGDKRDVWGFWREANKSVGVESATSVLLRVEVRLT